MYIVEYLFPEVTFENSPQECVFDIKTYESTNKHSLINNP